MESMDESSIDDELAAAEAKVAELRRLKEMRGGADASIRGAGDGGNTAARGSASMCTGTQDMPHSSGRSLCSA